ncbi:hypothetical protein E2320_003630 [Naja naja]|nr:hypothetical protein E2320_003630 [Naja naja]
MSGLGKLFGKGKKAKAPTPQEAIQKLHETETILVKKQEFLEEKIQQELQSAKKHGTKNKRAALQALKRKKRYEQQLAQIDGTLSTIEFQREALENATTNTEDELLAELEEMEQEDLDKELLNVGETASKVPSASLDEEDEEMKQLAAWVS